MNSSSKSKFGNITYINNSNNFEDIEITNLKVRSILEVNNKLICNTGEMTEIGIGDINISENIIGFEGENDILKIRGENISLTNNEDNDCLYLNGKKSFIGINNINPIANIDIDGNKGGAILNIRNGEENNEITYLLKSEGNGEVELLINETENIILKQKSLNRIIISILGVNTDGECFIKEIMGHIKNYNDSTSKILKQKYLFKQDDNYSERIEINNLTKLHIFCKGREDITTKWSVKIKIFSIDI
jgi:hypothetical protein